MLVIYTLTIIIFIIVLYFILKELLKDHKENKHIRRYDIFIVILYFTVILVSALYVIKLV